MRNTVNKTWALAFAVFGLSAVSARAEEIIVNVPFPFVVEQQTMPAGKYVVETIGQDPSTMVIRGANGVAKSSAIVLTTPAAGTDPAGEKPALTFTRDENHYRLSTIWESHSDGRTLGRS